MSQENVELAARFYALAATKAEILAALSRTMELCHPEIEWTAPEDGATYRGREGVKQRLEEWLESFSDYRYEISGSSTAEAMRFWSRQPRWGAAQRVAPRFARPTTSCSRSGTG